MNAGRFSGSSVIFRNSATCSSFGLPYATGMLKYFKPSSLALASSSAARYSLGCRRLMIALTPSALSFSRCSSFGWPPVQKSLLTRRKFLIDDVSSCATTGDSAIKMEKRIEKVFILVALSELLLRHIVRQDCG